MERRCARDQLSDDEVVAGVADLVLLEEELDELLESDEVLLESVDESDLVELEDELAEPESPVESELEPDLEPEP